MRPWYVFAGTFLFFLLVLLLVARAADVDSETVRVITTRATTTARPNLDLLFPIPSSTTTTLPRPAPSVVRPARNAERTTAPIAGGDAIWHQLAACESGGNWHIHDRLHSGGLQFAYATWRQAGGLRFAPNAHEATPEQQIQVAKEWLARTSPRQWPVCGRRVGLTMAAAA